MSDLPRALDLIPRDEGVLPCRLVLGDRLVLGRNRDQCDIVTWMLPRNEENDQLTLKLSQVHLIVEREDKGSVLLRDADSATGSFWNGQRIEPGEGAVVPVGEEGSLSLGQAYQLELKWIGGMAQFRPLTSDWHLRSCVWVGDEEVGLSLSAEEGSPVMFAVEHGHEACALVCNGSALLQRTGEEEDQTIVPGREVKIADRLFEVVESARIQA